MVNLESFQKHVLVALNVMGWTLYDFTGLSLKAGEIKKVIEKGPAEVLINRNTYIVFPHIEDSKNPKSILEFYEDSETKEKIQEQLKAGKNNPYIQTLTFKGLEVETTIDPITQKFRVIDFIAYLRTKIIDISQLGLLKTAEDVFEALEVRGWHIFEVNSREDTIFDVYRNKRVMVNFCRGVQCAALPSLERANEEEICELLNIESLKIPLNETKVPVYIPWSKEVHGFFGKIKEVETWANMREIIQNPRIYPFIKD